MIETPFELADMGFPDINQGMKPEEPLTPDEAELAEKFMIIAARSKDKNDLLIGYQLPAALAIRLARYALHGYKE